VTVPKRVFAAKGIAGCAVNSRMTVAPSGRSAIEKQMPMLAFANLLYTPGF